MTPMNFLVVSALVAMISTTAQACNPSDSDFKALAASPSRLTPGEFSGLPPERQELVCSTRVFIRQIDAQKGIMNEMEKYSPKYLSPAENDRMIDASNAFLTKIFKSKGF